MEELIFLIILIVLIVILYIFAVEFRSVAEMKGYYDDKYFWYAFLGIGGWLLIIALPDRTRSLENHSSDSTATPNVILGRLPKL